VSMASCRFCSASAMLGRSRVFWIVERSTSERCRDCQCRGEGVQEKWGTRRSAPVDARRGMVDVNRVTIKSFT